MSFTPSKRVLERYADLMVNFGLGEGKGIRVGETVNVVIPESARPLLVEIEKAIYKAGGNIILEYLPNGYDRYTLSGRSLYDHGKDKQLEYFPKNYVRALYKDIDHMLIVESRANPREFKGLDPKKMTRRKAAWNEYVMTRLDRYTSGDLTWTIATYGTEGMAKEAGLTTEEYWKQIERACYLDKKDPIAAWKKTIK